MHLSHTFLLSYFINIVVFFLVYFGEASFTILILSESKSFTTFLFSATFESPTFLVFSASAVSAAAFLFFLSFSACFYSTSSFSLLLLSYATFAAKYLFWIARISALESKEGNQLLPGIMNIEKEKRERKEFFKERKERFFVLRELKFYLRVDSRKELETSYTFQ